MSRVGRRRRSYLPLRFKYVLSMQPTDYLRKQL